MLEFIIAIICIAAGALALYYKDDSFFPIIGILALMGAGYWFSIWLTSFFLIGVSVLLGFVVAYLARDELVSGRKWFVGLIFLSVINTVLLLMNRNIAIGMSVMTVGIVSAIALIMSYNRKWTKVRRR